MGQGAPEKKDPAASGVPGRHCLTVNFLLNTIKISIIHIFVLTHKMLPVSGNGTPNSRVENVWNSMQLHLRECLINILQHLRQL